MQPCFTLILISIFSDSPPLCKTLQVEFLYSSFVRFMIFSGKPTTASIFHIALWFMLSNACLKSTKARYREWQNSFHCLVIILTMFIWSIQERLGQKPAWLGRNRFFITQLICSSSMRARILCIVFSKIIPLQLSHWLRLSFWGNLMTSFFFQMIGIDSPS